MASLIITDEEFALIEALLGRLLKGADEREQRLILHIHKRLVRIRAASQSDLTALNRLKQLAS